MLGAHLAFGLGSLAGVWCSFPTSSKSIIAPLSCSSLSHNGDVGRREDNASDEPWRRANGEFACLFLPTSVGL